LAERPRRSVEPRRGRRLRIRSHSRRRQPARVLDSHRHQHRDVRALPRLQRRRGAPAADHESAPMTDASYNAWKLVSLSPLPGWALVLLCAAVVAGIALAVLGLRLEPVRRRRAVLWALRIGAGLC